VTQGQLVQCRRMVTSSAKDYCRCPLSSIYFTSCWGYEDTAISPCLPEKVIWKHVHW